MARTTGIYRTTTAAPEKSAPRKTGSAVSSKLESPQDVERLAETIRMSLESQDPEIKAFLR